MELQRILGGDISMIPILGGSCNVHRTVLFGFIGSLGRERTGDGVIRLGGPAHQIQGDRGKLAGGAALQEQDFKVFGHLHQAAEGILRLLKDGKKRLTSMTHFHYGHTGSTVIEYLSPSLLQNFGRHRGGAGRKVIDSVFCHFLRPSFFHFVRGQRPCVRRDTAPASAGVLENYNSLNRESQ